jgi:predicted CXXCH cytochrome family protein
LDLVLLVALLKMVPGAGFSAEQCGVCHPESRVAFAESIHAQEQVTCTSCHGGDAETQDVERAHKGSFRSLRDRLATPEMCADCHSDLQQMSAYNLPVDQYAVYQTSQHGMAVAGGDPRAAVCIDCHGSHEVHAAADPRSSVAARNLPATCAICHSDEELMGHYGLDSGVVQDYEAGIHGRSLLVAGNLAAPNCTSCHGVHGATPPGVGDIDKVCGACHVQTRRAFLDGPHYQGMTEAGLPECASCHSNHAIQRFEVASIDTLCADCHGEGSDQVLMGSKIHTLIDAAAAEVDKAEALALEGQRSALDVEDHLGRIEEARTYLTEALPLAHSVSLEPVEQVTRRSRSIGEEVQHEIYAKLDRTEAHIGLVVFWFYVFMTLVVLFLLKRRMSAGGEIA